MNLSAKLKRRLITHFTSCNSTAQGRALYNLYNGNKDGKRFGTSVSTYNRERFKCQEPRLPPQLEEKLNKKLAEKPK